jgi:hypothetical protein
VKILKNKNEKAKSFSDFFFLFSFCSKFFFSLSLIYVGVFLSFEAQEKDIATLLEVKQGACSAKIKEFGRNITN